METSIVGYIGIMEKKMETTIVCWDYIGDNGAMFCDYGSAFWGFLMMNLGIPRVGPGKPQ